MRAAKGLESGEGVVQSTSGNPAPKCVEPIGDYPKPVARMRAKANSAETFRVASGEVVASGAYQCGVKDGIRTWVVGERGAGGGSGGGSRSPLRSRSERSVLTHRERTEGGRHRGIVQYVTLALYGG